MKLFDLFKSWRKPAEDVTIIPVTHTPTTNVSAQSKTYYIDNDALEYEKKIIAQRIGQKMLDLDLINYTIIENRDVFNGKIYTINGDCDVVVRKDRT